MNPSKILSCFFYSLMMLGCADSEMAPDSIPNTTVQLHVGVVLDMGTLVGKISNSCISMALADFYTSHNHYRTRLALHPRDSKMEVIATASAVMDLLQNIEVQAIIGPQKSSNAKFIMDLGADVQVPIISFSATSPPLSSRTQYFVQTTPNDQTQVKAIASIVQAFGWRKVILIHEDTYDGNRLIPYLAHAFQEVHSRVRYRSVLPTSATDDQILEELFKLKEMHISVFIVHMLSPLGSRLFFKAKQIGMMSEGYAWIITSALTNDLEFMGSLISDSIHGVLGVTPYISQSEALNNFTKRWKPKFLDNLNIESANMNRFGLWAYDTVWALAIAAERIQDTKSHILKPKFNENSSVLLSLRVSQIGPELLEEILRVKFKGLSGDFHLVNGQRQPSAIQILNVIGRGVREVGFWTPTHGISKDLNLDIEKLYSTSKDNFRPIIWPGNSMTVPNGWVIPMSGKKLRIGVPVKDSYSEFVKVEQDPSTNSIKVSGYCIDVFNHAIESLPLAIPYEFVPFQNMKNTSDGYYNDLIYQVYLQKYDAVVGDTTIVANRSLYVDFTLPYTGGGVWMIVSTKHGRSKNISALFNNLIPCLWLSCGVFIAFTGFVMWVLQHRGSKDFPDPTSQHVKMPFYLALSTLLHAHREKLAKIFPKLLVIIWLFVVFILTSPTLMVKPIQPTITDYRELIKNRDYVGYRKGSFVVELLKESNFDESRLKDYSTPEEYHEALSKGSLNGGIAAFFDELPYINMFLTKNCSKYNIVGPTYRTDGFGFVFPRGSPLVVDISNALLSVTKGNKMREIEKAWFPHQSMCYDDYQEVILRTVIITSAISMLSLILSTTMSSRKEADLVMMIPFRISS